MIDKKGFIEHDEDNADINESLAAYVGSGWFEALNTSVHSRQYTVCNTKPGYQDAFFINGGDLKYFEQSEEKPLEVQFELEVTEREKVIKETIVKLNMEVDQTNYNQVIERLRNIFE
ncbi:hypothetical protein NCTGTJJY_CDS0277 [Serratia phage 92A1]|nr:hypothetical protein NCTGTJJY_CDS0277 [Serratia phage 92A1]